MKTTTIKVTAKCSDQCYIEHFDKDGNNTREDRDDYVPDYFPEEHYGDYIELEIDVATGKILNWVVPTEKQIQK